jgi:hypothetical protein
VVENQLIETIFWGVKCVYFSLYLKYSNNAHLVITDTQQHTYVSVKIFNPGEFEPIISVSQRDALTIATRRQGQEYEACSQTHDRCIYISTLVLYLCSILQSNNALGNLL